MASSSINNAINELANAQINELSTSSSPNLHKNLPIFSQDQAELVKMLIEKEQGHLFSDWADPGVHDDQKLAFINHVLVYDSFGISPLIVPNCIVKLWIDEVLT